VQDKFWRTIACLMCVGLFYVGHGLHGPQPVGLPSLENGAQAAGVAWHTDSPEMFTVSEDGRIIYTWKRFKDVREGATVVRYMGRTTAPSEGPRMAPEQIPGQRGQWLPGRAPDPLPAPAPVK
jgi:hypothetical protein